MTWLNPAAFAFLAAIPVILLLHSLRYRRRDVQVSTLFLWEQVMREAHGSLGLRRLIQNLPLILQILLVTLITLALYLMAAAPVALAAPAGDLTCAVTENGQSAQGTMHVEKDGKEVASGSCAGDALAVPPGSYVVRLQLDGALDGPEQRKNVTVKVGQ